MRKIVIAALVAASLTGAGYGQDPPKKEGAEGKGQHRRRWDPARFQERVARHREELHQKLKLTAEQEPAWKAYLEKTVRPEQGQREDWGKKREEMARLSAPERLEQMLSRHKQMQARLEQRLEAVKTFYAVLTPEQKVVFDQNAFPHPRRGAGRRHRSHSAGQEK